jgi:hypothetical protein
MNDPRIVGACGAGADAALGTCCPRRVWRLHNPRAAVLKLEWRIAGASPEEQAMLDAHGFLRRCSEGST